MAAEYLNEYLEPEYPKIENLEASYRTTLKYIGPYDDLLFELPAYDEKWGNYRGRVTSSKLEPVPGRDNYGRLDVVVEERFEEVDEDDLAEEEGEGEGEEEPEPEPDPENTGQFGTARGYSYEVEWVMFQRSLFEHPAFRPGGGGTYELSSKDKADIEAWQQEPNTELQAIYKYEQTWGTSTGAVFELSDNAKKLAMGLEMGIETWEDYSPVIRKITTYAGGPPRSSTAGTKENGPSFAGKPAGYEWRKTADSAVRGGGSARWDRSEEWTGATKVLYDKESIFW